MRKYTLSVSIAVHAAAAVVLFVMPLLAAEVLPDVRDHALWMAARVAAVPDVPAPPRGAAAPPSAETHAAAAPVPPVEAPDGIAPETAAAPAPGDALPGLEGLPDGSVPGGVGVGGAGGGEGTALPPPPPPRPEPQAQKPVHVGGTVRRPQKMVDVAPVYPQMAMRAGISGSVLLEAVIAEDGRVTGLRVLRSVPMLDQAAVDAVRQWVFSPTLLNGVPTPVVMTVTVTFALR